MISKAIRNAHKTSTERSWDLTYWAIDIHGTMIVPNYLAGEIPRDFFPGVIEAMQLLSKIPTIKLILYTCSHPHEIDQYLEYFKLHNIHFDFVNGNPEVPSGGYGCFDQKFYLNVLMDDKAGFDPETDWLEVKQLLEELWKEHL